MKWHKWSKVNQRQMKKRSFDFVSVFFIFWSLIAVCVSLYQIRAIPSEKIHLTLFSVPVDQRLNVSMSDKIDLQTPTILVTQNSVAVSKMLNLQNFKDILVLPRKDFLDKPIDQVKIKSSFGNANRQSSNPRPVVWMVDPSIKDFGFEEIQAIQNKLKKHTGQRLSFVLTEGPQ
jgi:hypothetical protein